MVLRCPIDMLGLVELVLNILGVLVIEENVDPIGGSLCKSHLLLI
jgi:hypothetical protein